MTGLCLRCCPLRLPSYGDVLREADNLLASGYDRVGKWSLGQACHHLAVVMGMSLDGFPSRFSGPIRLIARLLFLPRMLRHEALR